MGRAQVRLAVQSAIQAAALPYVGTVYPARPTILQEEAYVQTLQGQAIQESANGSSCVVVVNLEDDKRQRRTLAGRGQVDDTNIHRVSLELWFASTAGDAMAAQEDYDGIVDGLFTLVRGNPTMSAPSEVWSAGEYTYGVQHAQSAPYGGSDGLTVLIDGVLRFEAWEWIAGQAGVV